ncbi:MAG: hypothetical protein K6F10_03455 [Paludibacteraceae bacterium]|nr:hypothetical protein [Paludibacteraceae bacterium]
MKRFFFLLSAVVVSLTMAAQMQVWSNGTIIFSHDQTDVDSISFGSPMQVQANFNALSSTSLAGGVYTSSLSGSSTNNELYALFFLDGSNGYYGRNNAGWPNSYINFIKDFTYSINGDDITISMDGRTIHGKVIGKNGLVFTDFYYYVPCSTCSGSEGYYPAVFVTLNR